MSDSSMTPEELRTRVLFSLLHPVARLASEAAIPLSEMKKLVELAYYREGKRRKLKMREIRGLLSVSMSKISLLSKQLKAHFSQADREYGTPRRLLSLLWAGPMSASQIAKALDDPSPAEVEVLLAKLVDEKRVVELTGATPRYTLAEPHYRLVHDPWMAKVDALNQLTGSLGRVVQARFFDGDPRAFARNLSFRVRAEDVDKLNAFYREQLFPMVVSLDEAAAQDGEETVPMQVSIMWAPEDV